jgi:hypothetical protein
MEEEKGDEEKDNEEGADGDENEKDKEEGETLVKRVHHNEPCALTKPLRRPPSPPPSFLAASPPTLRYSPLYATQ